MVCILYVCKELGISTHRIRAEGVGSRTENTWKKERELVRKVCTIIHNTYRGADKSLARPGRKQTTATEDFDVHISYFNHNWWKISSIYIYNKTSIKRKILTTEQNT